MHPRASLDAESDLQRRGVSTPVSLLIALLALTPALAAHAQTAPAPVFQSEVRLVPVDVTATNARGAFVSDLRLQDFSVLEDGKLQRLAGLDIEQPDASPTTPPTTAAGPPPNHIGAAVDSDAASALHDRRLIVLFFDWTSMPPNYLLPPEGPPFSTAGNAQAAVEWSEQFVRTELSPADRVAIATYGDDLEVVQNFTAQSDALERSLASLDDEAKIGNTPTGGAFGGGLAALEQLCLQLASIPQKKSIIVFSSGLYGPSISLDAAVAAANRANATLFPWDAKGLVATGPAVAPRDGLFDSEQYMSALATGSGGTALFDDNNLDALLNAVLRAGTYYVLSYYSANPVMDGHRRNVTVRADRPDVRLEYRDFYYAQRDFAHMNSAQRRQRLEAECLNGGPEQTLSVSASGKGDGTGRLAVTVRYSPGSPATAMVIVQNAAGKTVGDASANAASGTYAASFALPPGDYAVRAAVQDNHSGSVGATGFYVSLPASGH